MGKFSKRSFCSTGVRSPLGVQKAYTLMSTTFYKINISQERSKAQKYDSCHIQRYTYRVLQTIQMKLIFLCVKAEPTVLGSAETAFKFKYRI